MMNFSGMRKSEDMSQTNSPIVLNILVMRDVLRAMKHGLAHKFNGFLSIQL